MNRLNVEHWHIAVAILILSALFFLIAMKGYQYISYTLIFAALLIVIIHVGSAPLKKVTAILVSAGMLYFIAVEIPIILNSDTDKNPGRGYIVVLGAAVHGNTPSLSLQHRLEGAFDYLSEYTESKAVVSGGQGPGENISEAQCMHDWLVERGIDSKRIILEDRSTSTLENLSFSKALITADGGSAGDAAILSSPYHLFRAKALAKIAGYSSPAGVACRFGLPVYSLGMYIREAFGVTHLFIFGR